MSRLERLTDQDHIESFALVGWHCQACAPIKTPPEAPIRPRNIVRATIAEFTEWAAQHDYSLGPAFGQPTDQPPVEAEGEEEEQIDLPIICVAVYDRKPDTAETEAEAASSGQLVAVYPCVDGEGNVKTVENGLSALEEQSLDQ
ncbi:HTH domain-containing protein [Halalkalicoccus salilacus]